MRAGANKSMYEKILIIEDNPLNMALTTELLEAAGYVLLQAEDAEAGIVVARAELPALILMDIALPGMDGLCATRLLTQDPRTQTIPIIALTAHAMKGDETKVREAGCVGYIAKPLDTRTFAQTVADWLAWASSVNRVA